MSAPESEPTGTRPAAPPRSVRPWSVLMAVVHGVLWMMLLIWLFG